MDEIYSNLSTQISFNNIFVSFKSGFQKDFSRFDQDIKIKKEKKKRKKEN